MARNSYSTVGVGARILVLILLILILVFGGLLWFDYLGVLKVKQVFAPALNLVGIAPQTKLPQADDPLLLDRERLRVQQESLDLRQEELDKTEQELGIRETELTQKLEQLAEREQAITDREKSLNELQKQFENKSANLEQNAKYLVGMPPKNAVDILLKMEDQDIIDLLRVVEQLAQAAGEDSIVSYWLSLMPSDRAATIQRKMAKKPTP